MFGSGGWLVMKHRWWVYLMCGASAGAFVGLRTALRYSDTSMSSSIVVWTLLGSGGAIIHWLLLDLKRQGVSGFWLAWIITAGVMSGLAALAEYVSPPHTPLSVLLAPIGMFVLVMMLGVSDYAGRWFNKRRKQ